MGVHVTVWRTGFVLKTGLEENAVLLTIIIISQLIQVNVK